RRRHERVEGPYWFKATACYSGLRSIFGWVLGFARVACAADCRQVNLRSYVCKNISNISSM
ncbi:Hypothetical protein, partial CDS, partial [Neorhizobium galegae bv. orientalis]